MNEELSRETQSALVDASDQDVARVFMELRDLKAECRPDSNSEDLAITMIKATIFAGWDSGPRIVGTLKRLGFDGKHAGATLARWRGNNPRLHHWRREADGRYVVHDDDVFEPNSVN